MGRPRKSDARDGRSAILDAALDLFSTNGYDATTVRQIAAVVGVSDAALYSHFESKAEILSTLFEFYGPKAVYLSLESLNFEKAATNSLDFVIECLGQLAQRWFEPSERKFFRLLLIENMKATLPESLSLKNLQAPIRSKLLVLARGIIARGLSYDIDPEWLVEQFVAPITAIRSEMAFSRDEPVLIDITARLERHARNFFEVFCVQSN
jgi:AcrR family transcriptional regulator